MKKSIYFLALTLLLIGCAQEQKDQATETPSTQPAPPATPEGPASLPLSDEPYAAGEQLTIFAPSGLVLREKPASDGKKIKVLPYGSSVTILEEDLRTHPFTVTEMKGFDIKGHWVKVKANEKEGYLFDGYLSHFPMAGEDEFPQDYLERISKVTSTTSEPPADQSYLFSYTMNSYENGITFEEGYTEGSGFKIILLPISICSYTEAYLLANALYLVGGENLAYQYDPAEGSILGTGGDDSNPYEFTLSEMEYHYSIDFRISD